MPALGGATEWLDSEPLGPAELRGHVVLVDFWTLTCINWLRTEPYIAPGRRPTETTGWSSSASTRPSTRSAASGRRPRSEDRLPVAVDNDYAIWSAFHTTTGRRCTSSTRTAHPRPPRRRRTLRAVRARHPAAARRRARARLRRRARRTDRRARLPALKERPMAQG